MSLANFNAEEYWANHEFKKWKVYLESRVRGKKVFEFRYVRARTAKSAVKTAIRHSWLPGRICGSASLATPYDLGCVRS